VLDAREPRSQKNAAITFSKKVKDMEAKNLIRRNIILSPIGSLFLDRYFYSRGRNDQWTMLNETLETNVDRFVFIGFPIVWFDGPTKFFLSMPSPQQQQSEIPVDHHRLGACGHAYIGLVQFARLP